MGFGIGIRAAPQRNFAALFVTGSGEPLERIAGSLGHCGDFGRFCRSHVVATARPTRCAFMRCGRAHAVIGVGGGAPVERNGDHRGALVERFLGCVVALARRPRDCVELLSVGVWAANRGDSGRLLRRL